MLMFNYKPMLEVHVTIESNDLNGFIGWCNNVGVKPLYLKGHNLDQIQYKANVKNLNELPDCPFKVVRFKVECPPTANDKPLYYESHFDWDGKVLLPKYCKLSNNVLSSKQYAMITYREYGTFDKFLDTTRLLQKFLKLQAFEAVIVDKINN